MPWDKLQARGLGGVWLQAVQALYTDVPVVRTASGLSEPFQALQCLKQGCPLSPTYGAEVWGVQFVVEAAAGTGDANCAAQRLQMAFLRKGARGQHSHPVACGTGGDGGATPLDAMASTQCSATQPVRTGGEQQFVGPGVCGRAANWRGHACSNVGRRNCMLPSERWVCS